MVEAMAVHDTEHRGRPQGIARFVGQKLVDVGRVQRVEVVVGDLVVAHRITKPSTATTHQARAAVIAIRSKGRLADMWRSKVVLLTLEPSYGNP
jgi:hypothetical protein